MYKKLSKRTPHNIFLLEKVFLDVWGMYEELIKFPYIIDSYNTENGLLVIKIIPKFDLKKLGVYIKISFEDNDKPLLFDVSEENSSIFHALSRYKLFVKNNNFYNSNGCFNLWC